MDHSGDYADIESPSSVLTADSDASNQSAPDVSPPMPDMYHIPRQLATVDHRNTSGIKRTVATLKHKNKLQLKLNIPVSQTIPSPDFTSAQHGHWICYNWTIF